MANPTFRGFQNPATWEKYEAIRRNSSYLRLFADIAETYWKADIYPKSSFVRFGEIKKQVKIAFKHTNIIDLAAHESGKIHWDGITHALLKQWNPSYDTKGEKQR